tara:strand:- start:3894 stop:4796 length:903 start_codon:yes stop_codon:yes gene_type:complete
MDDYAEKFYVRRGEEEFGPYALDEINAYLEQGLLLQTDLAYPVNNIDSARPLSEMLDANSQPPIIAPPESPTVKPVSKQKKIVIASAVTILGVVVIGVLLMLTGSYYGERQLEEYRKNTLANDIAAVNDAMPVYKEAFPRTLLLCITIPQVTNEMGSQYESERRSDRENEEAILIMRQYMGIGRLKGDVQLSDAEYDLVRVLNEKADKSSSLNGGSDYTENPQLRDAHAMTTHMYARALEYLTANDNRNFHRISSSFDNWLKQEFPTTWNTRGKELRNRVEWVDSTFGAKAYQKEIRNLY